MILYMNSKVFEEEFLKYEKDNDILNSQYVIVSSRIKKTDSNYDNIIVANSSLSPYISLGPAVCEDDWIDEYKDQLESRIAFLASLVVGSIEENFNIILLCSKKETKINYLKYICEYIYERLGYPCYNYSKLMSGKIEPIKFNKEKVLKRCKKVMKQVKEEKYRNDMMTEKGRNSIKKSFREMSKKELKAELKKRDLYKDGLDRNEMLDILDVFL